jgi:queuosine precursor transporter
MVAGCFEAGITGWHSRRAMWQVPDCRDRATQQQGAHVAEGQSADGKSAQTAPTAPPMRDHRSYRYLDLVTVAFVVVLICSNLIGPAKAAVVNIPGWGPFVFGAGVLFFPISYIFGDILTEVYGYARARKVIWAGFGAMLFASIMAYVVVALPPAPNWPNQKAYEVAFGNTWRIAAASIFAYWCGEFFNSYVLAKMKLRTQGKQMGLRFVASTMVAELVDSLLFYPLAFYNSGIMPNELVTQLVWSQFGLKTLVEIAFLPLTYVIVNALKRAEGEDYFDRGTNFTPFSMKT